MADRKTTPGQVTQSRITPSRRNPSTPSVLQPIQSRTGTRLRSSRSVRHFNTNNVRPESARGILRRLAKITAPTTKRRVLTPNTVSDNKENVALQDEEDDVDLKRPRINFNIEDSVNEDDSELPVAPTPSALLDESDDDEEQPTITFHLGQKYPNFEQTPGAALVPHSDSALQDGLEEGNDGDDTFLTERGRRAISEEPTRMSRYSFGSIRMSDFGSELEVRRQSDRLEKVAALEADDNYGGGLDIDIGTRLDGETENLRNLQMPSPQASISAEEESVHISGNNDTFQLDLPDDSVDDHDERNAPQRPYLAEKPQLANTILEAEDADGPIEPAEAPSASIDKRQDLLESVAGAASTRPRKKPKMNRRGNMIPSIPSSLIKRIVHESQAKANKRKTTLGKDHMKALEQATEWFFEQVSEDLETYSQHSKRKKRIDAEDVLLLMKRQRVLRNDGELRKLAKDWLPREVLNELDLPDRP